MQNLIPVHLDVTLHRWPGGFRCFDWKCHVLLQDFIVLCGIKVPGP